MVTLVLKAVWQLQKHKVSDTGLLRSQTYKQCLSLFHLEINAFVSFILDFRTVIMRMNLKKDKG